jgi:hypothetical protein
MRYTSADRTRHISFEIGLSICLDGSEPKDQGPSNLNIAVLKAAPLAF